MGAARKGARAVGKTIKWAFISMAALIVLVIIAAIVGLGKASDDSEKNASKITVQAFRATKLGTPIATIRKRFGEPESTDETEVEGLSMECMYYGILSTKGSYQFCFQDGKLSSKNRFGG